MSSNFKRSIDRAWSSKIRPIIVFGSAIAVLLFWFGLMGSQVHVIETLLGVTFSIAAGVFLHLKMPKSLFETQPDGDA